MRISDWSSDVCSSDLIGFDFSAAFAFADAGAYFPQWSESPADIRALWSLVERLARGCRRWFALGGCARFRRTGSRPGRRIDHHGGRSAERRGGKERVSPGGLWGWREY